MRISEAIQSSGEANSREDSLNLTAPRTQTCVWCGGSGYIRATGIICRTCHGLGAVQVRGSCSEADGISQKVVTGRRIER
jgi:DnaJ-class molecular chaperone